MKKYYSISIPEPCHENWNTMTPREKGRHCDSCAKTVIDFTKMDTFELQDFIHQNRNHNICGHFKHTQLDSINIHIPSQILEKQISFHKSFLLVLLIVMGTSIMNCTNKNGSKQKIDSIEVIDSMNHKTIDVLGGLPQIEQIEKECKPVAPKKETIEVPTTEGEIAINILGDIEFTEPTTGLIEYEPEIEEEIIMGFVRVDTPPQFKDTPENLTINEKRDYFSEKVAQIVTENFNSNVCLDLKGKQKIQTQFKIDTLGNVIEVKARAPHPTLEKEAKRVINLLPKFIPAQQKGKPVKVVYSLPIIFKVEE